MRKRIWTVLCGAVAAGLAIAVSATGAAAADVNNGRAKYQQLCASCHGPQGKGDGPAAASLNPKPRDHSDAGYMKGLTDQQIFDITKKGGAAVGKSPMMPPWAGALTDKDIRDVVAFIRTLAKPKK